MVPIEVLKTSLVGYQKSGVEEYIARLRGEYNDRIVQDEMEHEKALSQLQEQLAALRQESQEELKKLEQEKAQLAALQQETQEKLEKQEAEYRRQLDEAEGRMTALQQETQEKLAGQETASRRQLDQAEIRIMDLEQQNRELTYEIERLKPAHLRAEQFRSALEEMRGKIADILTQDKEGTTSRHTQGKVYEFEAR